MKKYGIMTPKEFKEMTLAVARGEYKLPPDAPREYFEDQETADRHYMTEKKQGTRAEPALMTA